MTRIEVVIHSEDRKHDVAFPFGSYKLANDYMEIVKLPKISSTQYNRWKKRNPGKEFYTPTHGKYSVREIDVPQYSKKSEDMFEKGDLCPAK